MWELDCEESWAPKIWCFWVVLLEKTESPFDSKEIQPVHHKGDQSWVFIGRSDVKAETPVLWPPDVKSWLIGKDPDAGKDWRQEEKETTEDEIAGWHHRLHGREFELTPGVYPNSCPSNHLILCCPLLLLPSIIPNIRVFSNESALHIRWLKYWSFSFNISPSNEHSGLISFRMDWLDLLAVQGTLKSLLQHHSSKASILQSSTFFIVQISHPYMTIGKTIALTRRTFVAKYVFAFEYAT